MNHLVRSHHASPSELWKRRMQVLPHDSSLLLRFRGLWGLGVSTWMDLFLRAAPPLPGRFLVCIPRGGLNDVLCQVYRCMSYSIRTRRRCLVNTSASTIGHLDELFCLESWPGISVFRSLPPHLDGLDVWPPVSLDSLLERKCDFGWDALLSSFITFDFRKDYPHPVLVHSGRGGGFGFDLLRRLRLTDPILSQVVERLSVLPDCFDALQIRYGDIKSDISKVHSLPGLLESSEPLLLCSDSEEIIFTMQTKLAKIRPVLVMRQLRSDSVAPLHYDSSIPVLQRNVDLIVDLIALALARRLWVANQSSGHPSGFPRLAKTLHCHSRIARRLLGKA